MTPAERAVINAAIRQRESGVSATTHRELIDAVDALKHDDGCICPTDERVYCEATGCRGGAAFDPISGDLIPAGQDAELERMGREIAGEFQERVAQMYPGACPQCGGPCEDECMFGPKPILAASPHSALPFPTPPEQDYAPTWQPLTMQHVRPGDRVRPAGNLNPEAEITITARWWPPTDDARGRGSWHVIPGEKHWDDHVVQHGECVVELNGDGRARFLPPEMEIEILIAPAEVAAIEALGGWEQRA